MGFLPPRIRRINYRHLLPDLVLLTLSLYSSLFLRVGWDGLPPFLPFLNRHLAMFLTIKVATFVVLGVYDIIWRYISMTDSVRLFRALALSSAFSMAATFVVDIGRVPRAVFFIDLVLSFLFLAGIRIVRRLVFDREAGKAGQGGGRRTVIYGAGSNGRTIAQSLQTSASIAFSLVGFIDDDPRKVGRSVAGSKVLGGLRDLPEILQNLRVQEVIVAVSDAPGELLREIVQACRPFNIRPRVINGMSPSSNRRTAETLRPVELSDLLSRPVHRLDYPTVRSLIRGRRVLVTGAGGSIGSELARQILSHGPSRLMLLDHSEYNMYRIDEELRCSQSEAGITVPLLADVTNGNHMERIFREQRPEVVFHAAAYKHVHLVEANAHSAILNNVLGTKIALEQSEKSGVESFVLVSTDKAVNPVGVMGATKRVCELLVSEVGMRTGKNYCAVRFGNVLGSSGSLIPLLQRQIENGEPITITHKDVTRYFMLIPEAVSLVLYAAGISDPADIMILRMGDPVKIVDIAQCLIALMGRKTEDVPIVFTGLRPGEKLFEELYLSGDELETEHNDILVLPRGDGGEQHCEFLESAVEELLRTARSGSSDVLPRLWEIAKPPSGYLPTRPNLEPLSPRPTLN